MPQKNTMCSRGKEGRATPEWVWQSPAHVSSPESLSKPIMVTVEEKSVQSVKPGADVTFVCTAKSKVSFPCSASWPPPPLIPPPCWGTSEALSAGRGSSKRGNPLSCVYSLRAGTGAPPAAWPSAWEALVTACLGRKSQTLRTTSALQQCRSCSPSTACRQLNQSAEQGCGLRALSGPVRRRLPSPHGSSGALAPVLQVGGYVGPVGGP